MMDASKELRAVAKALNALGRVIDRAPYAGFTTQTVNALEESANHLAKTAAELAKRMGPT